jgi:hypothetical protein
VISTYLATFLNRSVVTGLGHPVPQSGSQAFDASRLEELVDEVIRDLGEAKNIRHLPKGECITVTISGTDDAGAPIRLTLKAKKEDIDDLASGKLDQEAFKKKVLRTVG